MISPLDALPDDPATLKAIILAQRAEAERMAASVRAYEALIQALKIRIAKLKRQKFGPSSEKIEREIDQLQLALEDLEVAMATAPRRRPSPNQRRLRQPPRRQPNAQRRVGAASRGSPRPHRANASYSTPANAARTAVGPCAWWTRMWRRSLNSSPRS